MYNNPYYFSQPPMPSTQNYPLSLHDPRTYPPVNLNILKDSVHTFPLLMEQGRILLNHLSNDTFARRVMRAAQEGKHGEVNRLLHSIGLKVPVDTRFSPTGVRFELIAPPKPNTLESCCSLTFGIQWGR